MCTLYIKTDKRGGGEKGGGGSRSQLAGSTGLSVCVRLLTAIWRGCGSGVSSGGSHPAAAARPSRAAGKGDAGGGAPRAPLWMYDPEGSGCPRGFFGVQAAPEMRMRLHRGWYCSGNAAAVLVPAVGSCCPEHPCLFHPPCSRTLCGAGGS